MSVIFIDSTQIEYNGTENEARFRLAVDTAADLSGLTHYDSIKIGGGSDALDISTGDTYIINSVGVWVRQPSANAWQNVYTKLEIDSMVNTIYQIMMYYHTAQESTDGSITFYTLGGAIGSLMIYGNGQQGETPEFVGTETANLFDYVAYFSSPFITFSTYFDYAEIQLAPDTTYTFSTNFIEGVTSGLTKETPFIVMASDAAPTTAAGGLGNETNRTLTTDSSGVVRVYKRLVTNSQAQIPTLQDFQNGKWVMCNLGTTALQYEPYGHKIPITCAGETITVYTGDPLRKALDGSDAVDVMTNAGTITREVDADGNALATPTTETIDFPAIPTVSGENTLTVDTDMPPSKIIISGE